MAAMTRLQMQTEVCNAINRHSTEVARDASTTLATRVQRWLNWAQTEIVRDASVIHKYEFSFLQTSGNVSTVDGTASYAVPTGTKNVYDIRITTSAQGLYLIYKDPAAFDLLVPDPVNKTKSCPVFYTVWSQKIEVFPVPGAIYTMAVRYSKYATDFAEDSSASDLLNMDDVITSCTAAVACESFMETERATYWRQLYLKKLEAAIRADMATTTPIAEVPPVVPIAGGEGK